jgi:hypothetical protein
MENGERLTYYAPVPTEPGLASVLIVIVNSRGATNSWFLKALQSAHDQLYPVSGTLVVDNNDHALSIGAAWNLAVQACEADYLLFLGDDDYLSMDVVGHLVGTIERMRERPDMRHLVMVSSFCTMIDGDDRPLADRGANDAGVQTMNMVQLHHTGMYRRDWLLDNPFNEILHKHVSTDMQQRIAARGKVINAQTYLATSYHYGYFYRQHIGMVSGEKVVREPMMKLHK